MRQELQKKLAGKHLNRIKNIDMSKLLWQPDDERIKSCNLTRFARVFDTSSGGDTGNREDLYQSLHQQSVQDPARFWSAVWEFADVTGDLGGEVFLADEDKMPGARFFPEAKLNFAQNVLRGDDDFEAIIFQPEVGPRQSWSMGDLRRFVSRFQQALRQAGVGPGDRVAAMLPNLPETMAAMLATTSLGAIWSSASPDFGTRGLLDRFGQIEPKVFLAVSGYLYGGKLIDTSDKVAEVASQLTSAVQTVIVPYQGDAELAAKNISNGIVLDDFLQPHEPTDLHFEQLPFDHPLYILFSSGTTGIPKCIVHCAGGILLKHLEEHQLQTDIRPNDRLFYFTTCGWMMWNWLVSAPASGASIVLFDGNPFYPGPERLFELAEETGVTHFGTSAKYIDAVKKSGYQPKDHYGFEKLRAMLSTGSPLAAESFDFVYEDIKADIHLASISGGTDICGCFVGGNPLSGVRRGEIQGPFLGQAMDVYDETGSSLAPGKDAESKDGEGKGELVCTVPFPSMPVSFWKDEDGSRYRAAYFERFDNIWCQGDFAEWTPNHGMIIHGRSDATLNPGGVRIGTAEIYVQVEQLEEVREAIAIGQDWDDDTRVVLFVVLKTPGTLDDDLVKKIKSQIRRGASPRHVPGVVLEVKDIPRTKSGKITEIAVRDIVHGREVKNQEALANPEALAYFRNRAELS